MFETINVLILIHFVNGILSDGKCENTTSRYERQMQIDKRLVFNKMRDKFILDDPRVEDVLKKYNRANYLPFHESHSVYKDKYIYLGCGAEFSSPFVQAEALHLLRNHLKPGANVLELGSGTGYLATCMAEMLEGNGSVVGLDLVSPLVDFSVKATVEHAPHLLEKNNIKLLVGDGRYGYKEYAPYDVIYTDCSLRAIPSVLTDQLKPGGRLIMTLGRTELPQYLITVDKDLYGRLSYSRIRVRNKVPRLCTNIKEQDIYYQRMYPIKVYENVPKFIDSNYLYDIKGTATGKFYTLPALSFGGKPLNSEEMKHFAAAEKRYQEKIDEMDLNYIINDPYQDTVVTTLGTSFTTIKTAPEQDMKTTTEVVTLDYEIWSTS
ncbi:hypothetical protein WDU94_014884 [Cyamophila willieti]